jgi:hypothetical protein
VLPSHLAVFTYKKRPHGLRHRLSKSQ